MEVHAAQLLLLQTLPRPGVVRGVQLMFFFLVCNRYVYPTMDELAEMILPVVDELKFVFSPPTY